MIDPADKLTQTLPLDEQPAKRKRGRPATGKAMTPAEKQRAYRERLKTGAREGHKNGNKVIFELSEFDLINIIYAWDKEKQNALIDPRVREGLADRVEDFRKAYKAAFPPRSH
ncbi:MAG: hypothetical protein BFD77_08015 [Pseudomonas sp. CO183]|jgi:hypothetical protein|nr:MAG: hypothetical protein BFD77_08015 [Pseudomonas sp. CO183]